MFKPVSNKVAFPQMEEAILRFWDENGTFGKSLKKNEGKERYKFYDGPPFATGLPHYGHLLAGTIKDIVPRSSQTLRMASSICGKATLLDTGLNIDLLRFRKKE